MPKISKSRRAAVASMFAQPWNIRATEAGALAELADGFLAGRIATMDELKTRVRASFFLDDEDGDEGDDSEKPYQIVDGVAVVQLAGVMSPDPDWWERLFGATSTREFAAAVSQAAADPECKAICLAIDSPGGRAAGCEEAAQAVAAAAMQKPCAAFAEGDMCSAAYMVGSAAGTIIASASSQIGCIGTLFVHRENSKADAEAGRKFTVISAGEHKADANQYEPLSKQGRETVQELIDSYYGQFVARVAKNRNVTAETVEADYGQGKTFLGQKAVQAGLADRVGTLAETIATLARTARPPADPNPPNQSSAAATPASFLSTTPGASPMDPRVMQRLVALGLITGSDSAATAQAVINFFYRTRGQAIATGAEQILADLAAAYPAAQQNSGTAAASSSSTASTPATAATAAAVPAATAAAATTAAAPAQTAVTPGAQQANQQGHDLVAQERQRILDIQARGALLGADSATIETAITAGQSIEQFLVAQTAAMASREPPVARVGAGAGGNRLVAGRSQAEAFARQAVDVLSYGVLCLPAQKGTEGQSLLPARPTGTYIGPYECAVMCLKLATGRDPIGDRGDIAKAALGDAEAFVKVMGMTSGYQTPGDFPNILAGIANRVLEQTPPYQGTTFQDWAARLPSVPDRRPSEILRVGETGEFPEHLDGDDYEGTSAAEDYSWFQATEYAKSFTLTPIMIEHDNLGAFGRVIRAHQFAHDMTLNRLCINIITGNPVMKDGYNLFDATNHGNAVALGSGAAPSTTQLSAMRVLMRKQLGVSGIQKLNYTVKHILCQEDHETDVEALLANLRILPTTVGNIDIFRNKVTYSIDPMLSAWSTTAYFGFMTPEVAETIAYAYQRGYETMRIESYYEPRNGCRVYNFAGRFAAVANKTQGIVYNPGA